MTRSCGIALALGLVAAMPRMSAAPSRSEELLARCASYLNDFVVRFSNIVAAEEFVQDSRTAAPAVKGGKGGGFVSFASLVVIQCSP